MNFGKHGRTLLLGALLASTSTLVFSGMLGGVATADSGTIKVGGFPADNSGNGNDPHIDTACVGIRMFGIDLSKPVTAVFETQAPTKSLAPLVVTVQPPVTSVVPVDVTNWLTALPASPQGYHVKVDIDGKKKTFWVSDLSTGCPKPVVVDKCAANAQFLAGAVPATGTSITAGGVTSVMYRGATPLNESTVVFTVDGTPVAPVYFDKATDGSNNENIIYVTPTNFAGGSHTASVNVTDTSGACAKTSWTFTSLAPGSTAT
ncbi:MAG: hypothetical protein QOG64_2205 [Acidimicrobiaceae bacterium]|nr:hypothetical protein [Acidimicrobiaceae bacterium]